MFLKAYLNRNGGGLIIWNNVTFFKELQLYFWVVCNSSNVTCAFNHTQTGEFLHGESTFLPLFAYLIQIDDV